MINDYDTFTLDKFEFENGSVLKNVKVEYLAKGTPKYDESGKITNMIIFCHGYEGNYSSINEYHQLTSPGKPLDYNKYFIVSIASLGFPGSCCPSTTELKNNFPKYNFKDKVNFKKQFLKEKYDTEKVFGIFGVGMGGYEVYTWACEFPEDMELIIIGNSSYKTNGYRYIVAKCIKSIIEDNQHYHTGKYDESITKTMITVYEIMYSNYFSHNIFKKMSIDEIDIIMEEFTEKSLYVNIYDFKYQFDTIFDYNLEDKLTNIKAKTLVIGSKEDYYFSNEYDVKPLKNMINNCRIELINFNKEELNIFDLDEVADIIDDFLNSELD